MIDTAELIWQKFIAVHVAILNRFYFKHVTLINLFLFSTCDLIEMVFPVYISHFPVVVICTTSSRHVRHYRMTLFTVTSAMRSLNHSKI